MTRMHRYLSQGPALKSMPLTVLSVICPHVVVLVCPGLYTSGEDLGLCGWRESGAGVTVQGP